MKTTVVSATVDTGLTFPVLMIHREDLNKIDPFIVKFFDKNSGVVISHNAHVENFYESWKSSQNFNINQFVKFTGKIIIEQ